MGLKNNKNLKEERLKDVKLLKQKKLEKSVEKIKFNPKNKPKKPFNKKKLLLKIKIIVISFFILFIVLVFNLDRFSSIIPSRYKFLFEQINDVIFGKVQIVEIYGNNLISKEEILKSVYKEELAKDDTVLINSSDAIIKFVSKNPVVKKVSVRRFLPNKMVVYVQEKEIILKFYDFPSKQFYAITKQGEVLNYYNPEVKIPLLIGDFETADAIKFYNKLIQFSNIFEKTTDIISFFGYRFDIVLLRKTLINLPEEELDYSLKILQSLIDEEKILEKNIKSVDLRVKGKIFIEYYKESNGVFKFEEYMTILDFRK